jgi:hypothetical protein
VISKLLRRLVVQQLTQYLISAGLLPSLQSGFRPDLSIETTVLRVPSDVLQAVDRGGAASLIILDLSAAFDTDGHDFLLQRLPVRFGMVDATHRWFQSYLLSRFQYVRRRPTRSSPTRLMHGIPHTTCRACCLTSFPLSCFQLPFASFYSICLTPFSVKGNCLLSVSQ